MNQNYFESNPSYNSNYLGFDQPSQYSIDHQEDLNQQRISDVHDRWDILNESQNELLNMMQPFCEMAIQPKQAANIDQSSPQEMSIQDMKDLKQQYLDEMKSMINQIQIEDYHNERIDIHYRRECEIKIDELKDFLIMGDEDLSTIPEMESDEVIKSSVEDLVLIPSESEDTSESDSDDDIDEIELLLHRDPSTPKMSVSSILEGFTNEPPLEENNDLFDLESKENEWRKILYDAPIDDLMTGEKFSTPEFRRNFFLQHM
nr:hypothetical protein [Tanacetum cinerariifolium]